VRRKGVLPLLFFTIVTVAAVAYTMVSGNEPVLGLDLQGGLSVVLQPEGDVQDNDTLDQAVEIIRNRVDALGVAEPDITRQGDTVLIQLPGVRNQDRALELVGQTAELRFRPVLQVLPPVRDCEGNAATTTTAGDGTTTTTTAGGAPTTTIAGGGGPAGFQGATTTTAPPATTSTVPAVADTSLPRNLNEDGVTPRNRDIADRRVVLPEVDDENCIISRYLLGPTSLTGSSLSGASAGLDQTGVAWQVNPTFKAGEDGIDKFNAIATTCFGAAAECPTGQLAIVLDGEVISAPRIQTPTFERDQIQITGDFTEKDAKDLALVLRYGALPVVLEPQQVQTVSATLGKDSLHAGVVAGVVGLAVTALFMILYYRLLGVIAVASLAFEFALLWAIVCWLGESRGLALTLAGVTGIIVSIGISVDSNVVFYEHLKEDVHNGRTFRSTVERSFDSSFATIIKADVASLIGAFLLYWLSVGPVRGFALLLGLSTILDIIAAWFFIRPAVLMAARSPRLRDKPRVFGMPHAQAAES
jgi:preprotein translocase subunit SecD